MERRTADPPRRGGSGAATLVLCALLAGTCGATSPARAAQGPSGVAAASLAALEDEGPAGVAAAETDEAERLRALIREGRFVEAEEGARALLASAESTAGGDSLEAARALDILVEALWRGGKATSPEARPLADRSLDIKQRRLDAGDTEVAGSVFNLASLLVEAEDFEAAGPLFDRALAIREAALGPNHPEVARTLGGIGVLRMSLGDFSGAREAFGRALAIAEGSLGPLDPLTMGMRSKLAGALATMGDHAAARPLFEQVLAFREKMLGPEHPEVAQSLTNLATLLTEMGEYDAARPLYERGLSIQEKALGPEHPDLAWHLTSLARLHKQTGDYARARDLLERALAIREKALGPDGPGVADTLNLLGGVLLDVRDHAGARPLFERALTIGEKALGPEHPSVAWSCHNLAVLHCRRSEYRSARRLAERALAIRQDVLGPDHPYVAAIQLVLAEACRGLGDYACARAFYERSVAVWERTSGPEHPDVGRPLYHLGDLLLEIGDLDGARAVRSRALAIQEKSLGSDHPLVATTAGGLADVLLLQGDLAAARAGYERALAVEEQVHGPQSPDVAWTLNNLAELHVRTGEHALARSLYERSIAILEALGPDGSALASILTNLAWLHDATGGRGEAVRLTERGLAMREKILGPDHPRVAESLVLLARLQVAGGELEKALENALRGEAIVREQVRRTSRALSEREALRYESIRESGLDAALSSVAAGGAAIPSGPAAGRAWDALLRSRALVLDEMAARHRRVLDLPDPQLSPLQEDLEAARARLARLVAGGPDPTAPEEYRALLGEAVAEAEGAERALAGRGGAPPDEEPEGIGLAEVVRALPAGSALVAYARYERIAPRGVRPATGEPPAGDDAAYAAFVARAGEAGAVLRPLGPAREIEPAVASWRTEASSAPGSPDAVERYAEAGTTLRGLVWDPVAPLLAGSRTVFVVPDAALSLVSFATLPLGDGRFALEAGPALHYLAAERDLVDLDRKHGTGRGLLVLGAPDFAARPDPDGVAAGGPDDPAALPVREEEVYRGPVPTCEGFRSLRFRELPGALAEADDVASRWLQGARAGSGDERVTRLVGSEAGEGTFKGTAPGHKVLHLATHAFTVADRCRSGLDAAHGSGAAWLAAAPADLGGVSPLLLSGLALAGANLRGVGEGEDGILTAEEVATLDLRGTEWVVLSGCETGVGPVQAGEGVLGLRRAFQVAGARTLIMALWPVSDYATREWMQGLYDSRLRGSSTIEAVRAAGLSVLHARGRAGLTTHPYFWGAFIAAGGWR